MRTKYSINLSLEAILERVQRDEVIQVYEQEVEDEELNGVPQMFSGNLLYSVKENNLIDFIQSYLNRFELLMKYKIVRP